MCPWCDNPGKKELAGYCSAQCMDEAQAEYDEYFEKFNDFMAGYDVTFEKVKRKHKRKEEE